MNKHQISDSDRDLLLAMSPLFLEKLNHNSLLYLISNIGALNIPKNIKVLNREELIELITSRREILINNL